MRFARFSLQRKHKNVICKHEKSSKPVECKTQSNKAGSKTIQDVRYSTISLKYKEKNPTEWNLIIEKSELIARKSKRETFRSERELRNRCCGGVKRKPKEEIKGVKI
jgi:hypothetical protein